METNLELRDCDGSIPSMVEGPIPCSGTELGGASLSSARNKSSQARGWELEIRGIWNGNGGAELGEAQWPGRGCPAAADAGAASRGCLPGHGR